MQLSKVIITAMQEEADLIIKRFNLKQENTLQRPTSEIGEFNYEVLLPIYTSPEYMDEGL